ncbi:hypothetical protein ABZS66_19180 [Dactylosporangium sp. NPDC005572]|uniref:hypothetical protein n=1 Tax=Dactylosporangium sp. NPDC005572 TaxID=3156889 RepID=UPI0033B68513
MSTAGALRVAERHAGRQRRLMRSVSAAMRRLWSSVTFADLDGSWLAVSDTALVTVTAAQLAAAGTADAYLTAVLAEQGIDPAGAGRVVPERLAGIASDGRALETLLQRPVVAAKLAIRAGATPTRALATGYATLDLIATTQVGDAGRAADQVALTARRRVGGYTRMISGRCCSRCAILAGRWYRWNTGFLRHPRCRCRHIPSAEDRAGDLRTNPRLYFASLPTADQNRLFTKAGAEAIRDGADISQVVNARRGMSTTRLAGRDLAVTTEGTTTRGVAGRRLGASTTATKAAGDRYRRAKAPRLMPESIYRIADGDREEAIRLLRANGYLR